MNNRFGISIVLAGILCTCANSQVMDIGTNYYRDYLDFAQNKGVFAPQDAPLEFAQRNGDKFTFDKILYANHKIYRRGTNRSARCAEFRYLGC